jgi:hypothetical protein
MAHGDDVDWDPDGNLFDTMNALGAQGWELVSTSIWGGEPALWFKRRLSV